MGDYRTTVGEEPPLPAPERSRRRRKAARIAGGTTAAVIALGLIVRIEQKVVATGYVTTEHYAEVRSPVVGTVAEILASSSDTVVQGDLLVQLEDSEERATRDESESRLRKIEAQLARREAEIREEKRQREAAATIARLKLQYAGERVALTQELTDKGLAAGRALQDEQLKEKVAKAELDALLTRDESLPEKELEILRRERDAVVEAVKRADARLRAKQIRAPMDGRVQRYSFGLGELVRPDTVLYEIFGGDKWVLKLRVPERYATLIAPGQPYEAELLPYKGRRRVRFRGSVEKLRGVIQAENQKTYRVAYCTFARGDHEVPPGTTGEAKIVVGKVPLWIGIFRL